MNTDHIPAALAAAQQAAAAPLSFALAGEIVTTPEQAKRILTDAIKTDKHWLIPQAESVLCKLRKQAFAVISAAVLTACGGGTGDSTVASPMADSACANAAGVEVPCK